MTNQATACPDCQRLYKTTDSHGKRLASQTFTTGIDIDEDEEATLRRHNKRKHPCQGFDDV